MGLEPTRPKGQSGLNRSRLTCSATRAPEDRRRRVATLRFAATSPLADGYRVWAFARIPHGSFRSTARRRRRPPRSLAASAPAVGRASRRAHPAREPPRLRGAGGPLPVAPAGVLPPHAVLARGRRGRAAGGLRGRVQRDAGRRARDQRAALAVPDRPQPLAEPPAPRAGGRHGLDGHPPVRGRPHHRGQGPQARGVPAPDRRRPGPAGDAAHRTAAARDRRALLRPDLRGDGDHGPVGEVAARARPRLPGRGRRGAAALLRRGAARARRGRRGPHPHERPRAPSPAHV